MIIRYTISEADRKRSKRNVVGCGFYRGGFLFPEAPDAALLVRAIAAATLATHALPCFQSRAVI